VSKIVTHIILFFRCLCLVREKVGVRGSTMTHENLSLFDAIHSQRAIRHFSEQPVSDEAVETMLNAAICAPNGGNRQPWRFVVIRDADIKRRLGQWYLAAWEAATADMEALTQPYRHGAELAQQMASVPVLILACIDHGDAGPRRGPVTRGASIYPAVQNLLLAACALGLGTVLTTLHTQYESEIKALLHIPDTVETAALIPVGYPAEGVRFGRARRRPLSEVVFHDTWG
jgi:nitroreductase